MVIIIILKIFNYIKTLKTYLKIKHGIIQRLRHLQSPSQTSAPIRRIHVPPSRQKEKKKHQQVWFKLRSSAFYFNFTYNFNCVCETCIGHV